MATTPTATHTYTQAGTYTITLTITDSLGQKASKSQNVTVSPTVVVGTPKAAFTLAQTNMTANFDGSSSTDGTSTIVSYAWNFGDGSTAAASAVASTSHTYSTSGVYNVTLTVLDALGVSATKTLAVTVPPTSQPSGNNVTWIQQLSGSDLTTRLNSVTAGDAVSFPAGTFAWDDFAQLSTDNNTGHGVQVITPTGLLGSGIGKTILKMNAGSTTKYNILTVGGNAALVYMYCANGTIKTISNLTIQGVSIGDLTKLANGSTASNGGGNALTDSPYIYTGLLLSKATNVTVSSVKISGIPGSDHVNPGETFYFGTTSGSGTTFDTCEADGMLSGVAVGATGFGINGQANPKILNCYAHDMRWSCGIALYHCSGTAEIDNFKVANTYHALNFEQMVAGSIINVKNPIISGSSAVDVYIGANSTVTGAGSSKLTISDPLDINKNPLTRITIHCGTTYVGTNVNLQKQSDIKVLVGGVDKTSSIVTWA